MSICENVYLCENACLSQAKSADLKIEKGDSAATSFIHSTDWKPRHVA